jgi:hypothetical protein
MSNRKRLLAAVLGAAAFAVPVAGASADHVKVQGAPPPVVVPPTPTVTPSTQTLQADSIKADTVRANIIYANKIVADQVLGAVHQSKGIKVKNSEGKIEAPQVAAGVIYADEIKANTVLAETIYVRNLDRR